MSFDHTAQAGMQLLASLLLEKPIISYCLLYAFGSSMLKVSESFPTKGVKLFLSCGDPGPQVTLPSQGAESSAIREGSLLHLKSQ